MNKEQHTLFEKDPTAEEQTKFGNELVEKLVGSRITVFGANFDGSEIILCTDSGVQVIIGKDESGDIGIFPAEQVQVVDLRKGESE